MANAHNVDAGPRVEATLSLETELEDVGGSHQQQRVFDKLGNSSRDEDVSQELFVCGRELGKELDRFSTVTSAMIHSDEHCSPPQNATAVNA